MQKTEIRLQIPVDVIKKIEKIIERQNITVDDYIVSSVSEVADRDFRNIVKPFSFDFGGWS
ncbi:hypothetical protein C9189_26405 [Escherichia coli]|uniref:hypothetical protein n=1 Tax=Escherichia coli TaxID=562 RepID=UPI0007A08BD8|nr:hypothetical protein [Escherichia coli]KYT24748.1 hypothetical protein AML46_09265 [Escherichia coli]TJF75854.1 hypothetical protein C9189_26405 [Escherichia coli]HDL9567470.1 hypothetical protein [Escherichia coli]